MPAIDTTNPVALSPSGLSDEPDGRRQLVGRCLSADARLIRLRDAFTVVDARWAEPPGELPAPLSMVRLAVTLRGGKLVEAVLLDARPCPVSPRETRRLVDEGLAERLRGRARVIAAIRAFFEGRGYLETDTPVLIPSPGLDLHLEAFAVDRRYLSTSPEYQMKRLLAGGLPRIFQLARCFRRAEQGARHNPEFAMLEWYRAGATMEAMMTETEALVRHVLGHFRPAATPILGRRCDLDAPFARLTVCEAFERFAHIPEADTLRLAREDEDAFFRALVEEVEPGLARLGVPVWLYLYPAPQASLARLHPADPRLAERFELYVADLELCNGFGELTDPDEQRARLLRDQQDRTAAGLPVYPIDEAFLAAVSEGLPPCAGNALGLDRLVALCLGAREIAEVMAFPEAAL